MGPFASETGRQCAVRSVLPAAELRTALGNGGGDSFLRIVRTACLHDRVSFGVELIRETGFERLTQHAPHRAIGARRSCGKRRCQRRGLGLYSIAGNEARDQSEMRELPAR
jgi:hypothetical protein